MLKSVFRIAAMASVLTTGLLGWSTSSLAAARHQQILVAVDMETPVTAEFKELRRLLQTLSLNADHMHALQTSGLHWQTHAHQLNGVRNDVNRVGDQLEQIKNMRSSAAPWQQDAFDTVLPIAAEVAERMNDAIQHLNDNPQYLWAPDYQEHLRTIPILSGQMYDLVDNQLKIVDARERLDKIMRQMGD